MKVIWLSQTPIPEVMKQLNLDDSYNGAGWMTSMINKITLNKEIQLSIIFMLDKIEKITTLECNGVFYYIIPKQKNELKYCIKTEQYFKEIIDDFSPNIIHVFGTESPICLEMLNATTSKNVLVQITGLVSVIEKNYYAEMPTYDVLKKSIGDLIRGRGIRKQKVNFKKRAYFEIEAIKKATYVLGRTTWDKTCTRQINPNIKYYFCNEILRDEFYKYNWSFDKCQRYSIFTSQGTYPIKGLHFVLQCLSIIIREFPEAKLYIAGGNIIKDKTLIDKIKMTSYGLYIKKLIKKNNLENNVEFVGPLDEKAMCQQFLKSNVFISGSTIENESNSVSEAKILGVPVVASYVGGVIDRVNHGKSGFLYQHNAPYMAAEYIRDIFLDESLSKMLSINAIEEAKKTNDRVVNINTLIEIYREMVENE